MVSASWGASKASFCSCDISQRSERHNADGRDKNDRQRLCCSAPAIIQRDRNISRRVAGQYLWGDFGRPYGLHHVFISRLVMGDSLVEILAEIRQPN